MSRPEARYLSLRIPVPGYPAITLEGRFPLSQGEWNHVMHVLDVMRPGLVDAPPDEPGVASPAQRGSNPNLLLDCLP